MNMNEIINYFQGKTFGYPAGQYVGQCLSSVKVYIQKWFGISPPASGNNSAYGYWTNFPNPLGSKFNKVSNTPTNMPKPGDIAVWNSKVGAGYGHIAIVVDANVNSFRSLDQNWGKPYSQIITHNYTNVYGWLTPKEDLMTEQALTPEQVDQIYLIFRGQLPSASERVGRTTSIYRDFGAEVKQTREALVKEINGLKEFNITLNNKFVELQSAFVASQATVDELNNMVKDLQKQLGDIKPVDEKATVMGFITRQIESFKNWIDSLFKKG